MEAQYKYINNTKVNISTGEIVDSNIALGTAGKSVDSTPISGGDKRRQRYHLQAIAKKLLPDEQVAQCMQRCGAGGVAVNLSPSTGLASFAGLATCKSVWLCPVCSAKITNGRRGELNQVLQWSRSMGYAPVLVTLTARHALSDSLAGMLAAMKLAKQKLHQSRAWRSLDASIVGHVTATEVTHGEHGWHVHFHMLVIVDAPGDVACLLLDLEKEWLRCLASKRVMLSGNGFAYDVQGADAAGDYVTKWGAAEEVSLGAEKKARGGRTPWQLLADAESDPVAAALFKEYAKEFKGKRQLVWSRDFKRVLGIIEKTDAEIVDAPEADDLVEVAIIPKQDWRVICGRRLQAELLEVAEAGGGHYVEMWLLALRNQMSKERLNNGTKS